jgi:hypothetical protein
MAEKKKITNKPTNKNRRCKVERNTAGKETAQTKERNRHGSKEWRLENRKWKE